MQHVADKADGWRLPHQLKLAAKRLVDRQFDSLLVEPAVGLADTAHLFWPFALASIPFAYPGGTLMLPGHVYKPLIGAVLIYAAWRSFSTAHRPAHMIAVRPHRTILLSTGAALGFLSGLTGVGGIFLSPLLLLFRWAEIKVISGIAAAFILVNSIAGLLGVFTTSPALPSALPYWGIAAVIGGFIGVEYGSRRLPNPTGSRDQCL